MKRCVNLDWLEVAVLEPITDIRDASFFRDRGLFVTEREYGSRVWCEIFTIGGADYLPYMEVRRAPRSNIIACNVVHLRFVNRVCYFDDAALQMQRFIDTYGYEFLRISRVDICLDFELFDYGDKPQQFMKRFMKGTYSKINQANIHAHGSDAWAGRVWNSVSWGSPSSDVSTKFYNKTLELYDPVRRTYAKPYIRQAWHVCGLVDDPVNVTRTLPDGTTYTPEIWRVEFSITSGEKRWFTIDLDGKPKDKQSIRNTLDMYDSRPKLLALFASLQRHYFRFKYVIRRYNFYRDGHTDGEVQRKDRCPDKLLFKWNDVQQFYKMGRDIVATSEHTDSALITLLSRLRTFREDTQDIAIRRSADALITYLEERIGHFEQTNPISRQEILALQQALRLHHDMPYYDPAKLIQMAREELRFRDGIMPFL